MIIFLIKFHYILNYKTVNLSNIFHIFTNRLYIFQKLNYSN